MTATPMGLKNGLPAFDSMVRSSRPVSASSSITALSSRLAIHNKPSAYVPKPAGCDVRTFRTTALVAGSTWVITPLGPPSTQRLSGVATRLLAGDVSSLAPRPTTTHGQRQEGSDR